LRRFKWFTAKDAGIQSFSPGDHRFGTHVSSSVVCTLQPCSHAEHGYKLMADWQSICVYSTRLQLNEISLHR